MARKTPITQLGRAFAFLKTKGMARLNELIESVAAIGFIVWRGRPARLVAPART